MIKKVFFYFMLKALLVLQIFIFLSWVLAMQKNDLIKKLSLISKTGHQIITVHILLNVSRSKVKQAMKFGQSIEHTIRNIFLKKSNTRCGGEACLRPFYRKSKSSICLDHQFEMLKSLFVLNVQLEVYQNIFKQVLTTCFYFM